MSNLRTNFFCIAAASVTVLALMQSPSAQNSGTAGKGKDIPTPAASAAADKKASDAMLDQPTSAPTDAAKKAAAAMRDAGNPAK